MGRRHTAAELEEMARIARARETAQRQATVDRNRPYRSRGDQVPAFYRSLLRFQGADRIVYSVSIDANTVALIALAQAGLLDVVTTTAGVVAGPMRGSGVHPTKISWYYGDSAPEVVRTSYGSRWIRFYDPSTGNQSHRSTPFSETTGVVGIDTLRTKFLALFGPGGSKRAACLGVMGKASLSFERGDIRA